MQLHEFHQQYANLPFEKRDKVLDLERFGKTTMNDLYKVIDELGDSTRPLDDRLTYRYWQQRLLSIAEEFLPKLKGMS